MNRFNEIKNEIETYLDKSIAVKYPSSIYESMRYSVLGGGKRLRGILTVETGLIYGAKIEELLPTACAIEMLHSQSLIHDDLPCMDNDDYRRGKLSNHKVYGESTAVLAGDALLSYAPKFIIDRTPKSIKAETILQVLSEFFTAAGVDGIISGQIVDIDSENKEIADETLKYIYEYKTTKLFKCAVRSGAIIAGVSCETLEKLTLFIQYYGEAFQIKDDVLDVTSTREELGKTPNKDINSGKSTYVSKFGIDAAKNRIIYLCNKAYDILKQEGIKSDVYEQIIKKLIVFK